METTTLTATAAAVLLTLLFRRRIPRLVWVAVGAGATAGLGRQAWVYIHGPE